MLAHSDLQRSIHAMTLGLARARARRSAEGDYFRLTEREVQYQREFSGVLGAAPVELDWKIAFDVVFLGDAGNQRDSTLDRPQVRLGWERGPCPPGTRFDAFVTEWLEDADYDIAGVTVTIAAWCPALDTVTLPVTGTTFNAALHIGFQGFCAVWDADSGPPSGNSTVEGGIG